jgi:hypothetical protein
MIIHYGKEAKFQLLQNLSQLKGDNMNNKICEADRHFRSNKTEYPKEKNNELKVSSKKKNFSCFGRDIKALENRCHSVTLLVNGGNGDLPGDSHIILNMWQNYFCQLLNIRGIIDVRQMEVHTIEPLVLNLVSQSEI